MRPFRFAALLVVALAPPPATHASPEPEAATELDQVLAAWEQATRKIQRLDCEYARFKYDRPFEVEKRAVGSITLVRQGRARYRTVGIPVQPGAASGRSGRSGAPYSLREDQPDCWQWTGPRLYRIDESKKTYEASDVPPNGKIPFFISEFDVWHFFWAKPFLLGMPADELKEQFAVTIIAGVPDEVRLQLVPRRKELAVHYESATVVLDRHTWLAKAFKLRDPTGSESVHVVKNMSVNSWARWLSDDLSKPNLDGYRRVGRANPPGDRPTK